MGCAACFRGRAIAQPYRRGSARSHSLLLQALKQLQPCQLIPEQKFQRLWRRLADECEPNDGPVLPGSEEEIEVGRGGTAEPTNTMSSKWKLLIFCRGFDFYEKQQDQVNAALTHSCFGQIAKDLHRTFPEEALFQTDQAIDRLQQCLCRIALYFPAVGYTQGINFIVGYLMLRGYNDTETFWMVAYLSLCQSSLLLGLFEDGFPLASIYCRLFRLLLRQELPLLYSKITQLAVSDEIWIFKWFMTYFLYSFPMEAVEQAWDVSIMIGGVGLVYFALALVEQLEPHLMGSEDDSDVSALIGTLKDPTTFKTLICLKKAVSRSYELKITDQQISEEIRLMKEERPQQNFYMDYYASFNDKLEQKRLAEDWRARLKAERVDFRNRQLELLHSRKFSRPRRKQSKFRVKDQQRKEEQLRISGLDKSVSVGSGLSQKDKSDKQRQSVELYERNHQIINISRVLSQADSQRLPSEQSVMEIIVPQDTNRSDRKNPTQGADSGRMNASVHVIAAQAQADHPEQHEIQIFDLKGKPISFKKKKVSENGHLKLPHGRIFKKASQKELKLPRRNPSISKHDAREILQSIQNEDRSVVEFEGSSNFLQSTSDKKPQGGSPESLANNESIKVISLEDGAHSRSIEVESIK